MDKNTKVYFTLGIGYPGANHEDEFTLDELGYNPELHTDLDKFLETEYLEWRLGYLDGWWSFEK